MKEQIKKLLDKRKLTGKETMIVILLMGALLAVIAIPTGKKDEAEDVIINENSIETIIAEDYQQKLETRLEAVLSQIEGVGKVEVMITLQASSREVIEKDLSTQQDYVRETEGDTQTNHVTKEENTVYRESGDGSTPYVVQEIYPEVEGVLVVAEGGDDSYVNLTIVDAIQALFGIDVHKIKIVKMNTN